MDVIDKNDREYENIDQIIVTFINVCLFKLSKTLIFPIIICRFSYDKITHNKQWQMLLQSMTPN